MPEGYLPSASLGSLVCLPYLGKFAVAFVLKDTWCLLPTTSNLGLKKNFLSILFARSNWQHNCNDLKYSTITSSMWHWPKALVHFDMQKSITNHTQSLINLVLARSLAYSWVLLLLAGYSCNKKRKNTLLYTKKNFSVTSTNFSVEKKKLDFSRPYHAI